MLSEYQGNVSSLRLAKNKLPIRDVCRYDMVSTLHLQIRVTSENTTTECTGRVMQESVTRWRTF